tara:strand:+ start:3522 stop:4862 length:1341 start_codon:yes stop_codon:yes gene_type:complete
MNLRSKINNLVSDSRKSQQSTLNLDEKKINNILIEIKNKILDKKINYQLSKLAVEETKFGNIEDKIEKNNNKTLNLVNYLLDENLLSKKKIIEKNIYEIYKPVGLICGVTPSTNPIATPLNYILNSIKSRNAIILCPNPRAFETCFKLVALIKDVLLKLKISENLVNVAPKELLRGNEIIDLFNLSDLNIVTGNKSFISRVKISNKPYLIFGVGNPPIIIDNKNELKKISKSIIESKSFDYSTSCSADSVLIIDNKIYENFLNELKNQNTYILKKNEKKEFDKLYFVKGTINQKIIAKSPNIILNMINIKIKKKIKLIGYEVSSDIKEHFILDEKILPLIGIIKSKNFDQSVEIAKNILKVNGIGHSAGIYSDDINKINKFAENMPVSRIIVNQPNSKSAGGNKNNDLKTTLSLGCGYWAGNILNENLSLKHFCNITRIVFKKTKD